MKNKGYGYINGYFSEGKELFDKISKQEIDKVVKILFDAWKSNRHVFVIGNGGSASNATHFAADLVKTVIDEIGQKGIKAIALADNIPLMSALTNDWGWENVYSGQLHTFWSPGSVVIGISVHGGSGGDKAGVWSQNLLKAMQFAKDKGGKAIGFSGFDGGAMKDLADVCIVVPAESTPLVESFHSVLQHLITFRLKELIASEITK